MRGQAWGEGEGAGRGQEGGGSSADVLFGCYRAWGRLDDRPQVAQRLELVGVDLATLELDSYRLRNGAHWRVGGGGLCEAQTVPAGQGVCAPRPRTSS